MRRAHMNSETFLGCLKQHEQLLFDVGTKQWIYDSYDDVILYILCLKEEKNAQQIILNINSLA